MPIRAEQARSLSQLIADGYKPENMRPMRRPEVQIADADAVRILRAASRKPLTRAQVCSRVILFGLLAWGLLVAAFGAAECVLAGLTLVHGAGR